MRNPLLAAFLGLLLVPAARAAKPGPAQSGPAAEVGAAVARFKTCSSELTKALMDEAKAREQKCRKEFPPLSQAFGGAKNMDLAHLICFGGGMLDRYARCREAATGARDEEYCRWRDSFTEAELQCFGHLPSRCSKGTDETFGGFARLGRALIDKEPGAAKLCGDVLGVLSGPGVKGCELLAKGDVAGACASPGFDRTPPGSKENTDCVFRVGVFMGTGDCSDPRLAARPNFLDMCRDMRLYRKARAAKSAAACGEGADSIVCRALMTRDVKVCEAAVRDMREEACSRFVKGLKAAPEMIARAHTREALGPLNHLASPWLACKEQEKKARAALASAVRTDSSVATAKVLRGFSKELEASALEMNLVQPPAARAPGDAPYWPLPRREHGPTGEARRKPS